MTAQPAPASRRPRLNRAEQKRERTEALLTAAWEVFCEKGYEAATVDEVAERAGYSRMPVYSLFGDKQTLFFELWQKTLVELSGLLLGDVRSDQPLHSRLKLLADRVSRDSAKGDQHGNSLFFVIQTIALSRPEIADRLRDASRKVVADFTAFVEEAPLATGERLRGRPEVVAAHLIGHINGISTVQFQTGNRYLNRNDLHEIFLGIALRSA